MERQYKRLYTNLFGMGIVLIFFLLLSPSLRWLPVGAQTQPAADTNKNEFDDRISAFFDMLKRGNATAFDDLLRGSPLGVPDAGEQLEDLRKRVDGLQVQFGTIQNSERLDTRQIGTNIVVVRHVLLYDSHPVIWTFTFYRKPLTLNIASSSSTWVLIELHFDTSVKNAVMM